jgi:hypothetical protein
MPARPAKTPSPSAKTRAAYAKVPTKTVAEDPAGGFTKNPHDYGDLLIRPDARGRTKLGGTLQRDIVYWISRETWGKNVGTPLKVMRPEWAKLSLTQLAKLCGSDRRDVARALADLQQPTEANPKGRGIIEARDRSGCGPTVAKMYKLTPERWKKAPYYEPVAVNEIEAADEEAATEETPASDPIETPDATVDPGKASKPQRVAVNVSSGAPAVAIRVVYRSVDLPFPVRFNARSGRNGRVQISCRVSSPQFFANSSPHVSGVSTANVEVKPYDKFLTRFVLDNWGKAADKVLIESVISEAGGASISVYENIVRKKFVKGVGSHTTGLLISLAKEAARAHNAIQARDAQEAAEQARQRPQYSADELAALEAEMHRPTAPEAPRCGICKGSGKGKEVWSNQGGIYAARPTKCEPCKGTGREVAK